MRIHTELKEKLQIFTVLEKEYGSYSVRLSIMKITLQIISILSTIYFLFVLTVSMFLFCKDIKKELKGITSIFFNKR